MTIETLDGVERVAREWEELATRTGAVPFVHPGWVSAWWDSFGSDGLQVMALRRDGHLAGVLPVRRRHGAVYSPTNLHTPFFELVAEDDSAKSDLLDAVFAERPRRVDLAFLLAEGHDLESLNGAAGSYRVVSTVQRRSPFVAIVGDWDTYLQGLSKKLRGNLRYYRSRLEEQGEVVLQVADGSDDLDDLLAEGFAIEASGWKGEGGTAIISAPETKRFYELVASWAAGAGFLRLAFLRVDGRAVAFSFNIEADGRHYLLKQGYDVQLSRLSPGTVLTAEMMSRAFQLGLKSYEFLGSADSYKLRWTKTCRDLLKAQAFARTPSGATDRWIQTHGRAIAKKILRRA